MRVKRNKIQILDHVFIIDDIVYIDSVV